jgi:hypothetical protein
MSVVINSYQSGRPSNVDVATVIGSPPDPLEETLSRPPASMREPTIEKFATKR